MGGVPRDGAVAVSPEVRGVSPLRAGAGILLSIAGMAVCWYLLGVHIEVRQGAGAQGLCNVSETVQCASAATSAYASIGGFPVAALGIGFYSAVAAGWLLAGWGPARWRVDALRGVRVASVFGVAYSLFLAGVSVFVLRTLCPGCVLLYVVNGCFAALALTRGRAAEPVRGGWPRTLLSIPWLLAVLSGTSSLVVTQWASRHWTGSFAYVPPAEPTGETHRPASALVAAPAIGPEDAPVRLVLFTDFQCPFCRGFEETLERAVALWGERLRIEVRQFPLPFHEHALGAAKAAVCADEQGRYWPLHRLMFANQGKLDAAGLAELARQAGVDLPAWRSCIASSRAGMRVEADVTWADANLIHGTPSFTLGGRVYQGALELEQLNELIASELGRSGRRSSP